MCDHFWIYDNGRSRCNNCGEWAADLRCFSQLQLRDGSYPTATGVQNDCACRKCYGNFRTRMVDGALRIICDGCGKDVHETGIIHKHKRDWIIANQEIDAMEVMDGLPAELRAALV